MEKKKSPGRPPLEAGESGKYELLLMSEQQVNTIFTFRDRGRYREEDIDGYMSDIESCHKSRIAFYQAMMSFSFYTVKAKQTERRKLDEKISVVRNLTEFATQAGINYHNLKRLNEGGGASYVFRKFVNFTRIWDFDYFVMMRNLGLLEYARAIYVLETLR